ncbi:phosphoinositide phospholipase C 2-like protein isoform X2 [Tanacetum coccineum]
MQRIISLLHAEFAMIDLGPLNYFLGISATRTTSGIFLSQIKYAIEILEQSQMLNCNPCRTLIDTEKKLGPEGSPVTDPTLYRSLAGSLQHLTFTRPDFSYTVQQLCLYMHDHREPHLYAMKRVLRYLRGTTNLGLQLFRSTTSQLIAYSDADWAATLVYCDNVMHNMEAPLAHYFVYTGHNSYLTGNQISSDCSVVPIIDSLKRGVRVIELDMWPSSTKDDIDIIHGGTLTAPVKLIKCLEAIKTYAFVASEYPVILTLEDHLTPDLQAKVAKMVTETYGDVLYYSSSSDTMTEFPSPELLKKRIVVSTKPPKEYLDSTKSMIKDDSSVNMKISSEEVTWGEELSEHLVVQQSTDENDEDLQYEEETLKPNFQYKQLIAIQSKKLKGGVKDWLHDDPTAAKRISLRETRLEKAIENHATDVIRFTQRNLLRVFPKGSRVDSSNYNPFIGWTHGAQMVAFNMQTHGRSLWLMQGMFRANGGCGYVKKPDFFLKDDKDLFDPKSTLPVKKTLKVKVYMGDGWHLDFKRTHFDVYSPPDFYVKVGIAGVEADSVMKCE